MLKWFKTLQLVDISFVCIPIIPVTFLFIQNMEVGLKKSLSEKHAIDPLMVQYMEMIQNQSEKVEQLLEQAPKENVTYKFREKVLKKTCRIFSML